MKGGEYGYVVMGRKARITEFQASIVITQMTTSDQEITRREENGKYLALRLKEIPGIAPMKEYPQTTRLSHHTCGFRYKAVYSKKRIKDYRGTLPCPESEQLVKETMGFSQNVLLGTQKDMDDIVDVVQKVYENRKELIAAT